MRALKCTVFIVNKLLYTRKAHWLNEARRREFNVDVEWVVAWSVWPLGCLCLTAILDKIRGAEGRYTSTQSLDRLRQIRAPKFKIGGEGAWDEGEDLCASLTVGEYFS